MKLTDFDIKQVYSEARTSIFLESMTNQTDLDNIIRRQQLVYLTQEIEKLIDTHPELFEFTECAEPVFNTGTSYRVKINLISDKDLKELLRLANYGEKYLSENRFEY